MRGHPLAHLMGETLQPTEEWKRPLPEAQVMQLREACEHYGVPATARFKQGDLVTPQPCSPYDNNGDPHLVLEVLDKPLEYAVPNDVRETFSTAYCPRQDMRIAVIRQGPDDDVCISTYWVESYVFVPWEPVA